MPALLDSEKVGPPMSLKGSDMLGYVLSSELIGSIYLGQHEICV